MDPRLPSRWRWLTLTVVVNLAAIAILVALDQRREEARDAEASARLFSAEIRQAVADVTLMRAVLRDDGDEGVTGRIVTATVAKASARLGAVARLDPERADLLRTEAATIDRAARSSNPEVADALLPAAAERAQQVADDIARSQGARAAAAARQSLIGSAVVLLLTVCIIAALLSRSQRTILRATRAHARDLRAIADRDGLTGLANRRRMQADLSALADGLTEHAPVEVAVCDLDGFKAVNDELGHEAGDGLLVDLSRRLEHAVGADGTVYRLGGDEFCVLSRPGRRIAAQVERVLAVAGPLGGHAIGSSGVALWPGEAATARGAIRLADERMYASKYAARPRARPAGVR